MGSSGSEQKLRYSHNDMPISSFSMPGGRPFRSFKSWQRRYRWCGPTVKQPVGRQVVEPLGERWGPSEKEAAVWKRCADAAACGQLLVDLTTSQLTRLTPLICLAPGSPPILPAPLPSELESSDRQAAFLSHHSQPTRKTVGGQQRSL